MKKAPIPTNSLKSLGDVRIDPTPIEKRRGIKISNRTRELYEKRNRELDKDPDSAPLPPGRWADAMRRDEFFRPIKKQVTTRIDADVLDWLKSQGEGHLTRINTILRERMQKELEEQYGKR